MGQRLLHQSDSARGSRAVPPGDQGRLLRILVAGSEAVPFAKTGGLADVLGALPRALERLGHEIVLVLPLHGAIDRGKHRLAAAGVRLEVAVGVSVEEAWLWKAPLGSGGAEAWFLENRALFDRPELYGQPDDAARYAFFARAVVELFRAPPDGRRFDVLHANDWQTALSPIHLAQLRARDPSLAGLGSLLTIHNLAYQGVFPAESFPLTGLAWDHFNWRELEFWGRVNYLKGGLVWADVLNTVSRRYAREILTPQYGSGLEGVLADREVHGVLNGVDYDTWSPEIDPQIPARYSVRDLQGKAVCREALLRRAGLPVAGDDLPLIGMIGRLAAQKGLDLVEARLHAILDRARVVLLGSGDAGYEHSLRRAAGERPDRLSVRIGYDEAFAHLIEAGADLFLMPSAYEPCGLNQVYSLRYGTVPVVRATGGLDDTIADADADPEAGNGFKFEEYDADALLRTLDRALAARREPARWERIRRNGMLADFSWDRAARRYVELYDLARSRA